MIIVLDTNVLLSGIFFGGPPSKIIGAWRDGKLTLALSPAILHEYRTAGRKLRESFPTVNLSPVIDAIVATSLVTEPAELPERICAHRADEKFLACALALGVGVIVSGDGDLLALNGVFGLEIARPSEFVKKYLAQRP